MAPFRALTLHSAEAWHPRVLGMQLTIEDPGLGGNGVGAAILVTFLERTLAGGPV